MNDVISGGDSWFQAFMPLTEPQNIALVYL